MPIYKGCALPIAIGPENEDDKSLFYNINYGQKSQTYPEALRIKSCFMLKWTSYAFNLLCPAKHGNMVPRLLPDSTKISSIYRLAQSVLNFQNVLKNLNSTFIILDGQF